MPFSTTTMTDDMMNNDQPMAEEETTSTPAEGDMGTEGEAAPEMPAEETGEEAA
jgi:hypothetical protein